MSTRGSFLQAFGPARGNGQVVQEEEPLSVQTAPKHGEDQFLEVLRAVGRSEGQPSWEITSACRQNGHFARSLLFVEDLVEPFLQVSHANVAAASDSRLNAV